MSASDPADHTAPYVPETGEVTMFTTSWCGYCRRLKAQLDHAGVPFREVDIENDDSAVAIVTKVNNGNRTVPTVLFPDGTTATNPSAQEVRERVDA